MKKVMMAMTMMFALGCFAQTSDGSASGSASGSSGQSTSSSGSMSSGQSGSMDNNGSMSNSGAMKGDKTLKGCIQSQNGGYMLEEKGGKTAMLNSSQDLSAHVGHMVKVHGMWQKGSMSSGSMSSSNSGSTDNSGSSDHMGSMANSTNGGGSVSSGSMDHSGKSFMVDKLDMISDQCKMDKDKNMSH
jgi:hypothetical protein